MFNRKKALLIDSLLIVVFVVMAASGFAVHFAWGKALAITHSASGVLFIVLVILHIVNHAKMIKQMMKSAKDTSGASGKA